MPSPLISILIALLGLIAVQLAGRRSPVLTGITLATLLALPLLGFLPKIHLDLPAPINPATNGSLPLLPVIYLTGLAFFTAKLLLDFLSFHRWKKQSTRLCSNPHIQKILHEAQDQLGVPSPVQLRIHSKLASPVASGLLKPTIHLPESALAWSDETLRAVLLHELGHHARHDLWTAFAARLACLLHWFNPFAWLLRKQLLTQCEFACDARVLATGIDPKSYAHTLCDLAQSRTSAPSLALAMANKSALRERVENLLSPRQNLGAATIALTIVFTLGTALALSTLRPLEKLTGSGDYSLQEVQLRLTANPFPGN